MNKVAVYYYADQSNSNNIIASNHFQELNQSNLPALLIAFSLDATATIQDPTLASIKAAFPSNNTPAYHFFVQNNQDEKIYYAASIYGNTDNGSIIQMINALDAAEISFGANGVEQIIFSGQHPSNGVPFGWGNGIGLPPWLLLILAGVTGYKTLTAKRSGQQLIFGTATGALLIIRQQTLQNG